MSKEYIYPQFEKNESERKVSVGSTEKIFMETSKEQKKSLSENAFSDSLKAPEGGSYLNNLKKLVTGAVLIGTTLGQAQESIAPTISKEKIASDSVSDLVLKNHKNKEERGKIKLVLDALKEKGGIKESDELDLIGRPQKFGEAAFSVARKEEIPHYFKPENILGKHFIKENPHEAAEYIEKIHHAIHATAFLRAPDGQGSAAIINTRKGVMLLSNYHVVTNSSEVYVEFANQTLCGKAKIVVVDKKNDLALLEISELAEVVKFKGYDAYADKIKTTKTAALRKHGINSLDVMSNKEFDDVTFREHVASIGNPVNYPFAVSMSTVNNLWENTHGIKINATRTQKNSQMLMSLDTDDRFENIAVYGDSPFVDQFANQTNKKASNEKMRLDGTVNYFGKSGGPTISLDRKYDPKLLGLNVSISRGTNTDYANHIVPAKSINAFLKKYDY